MQQEEGQHNKPENPYISFYTILAFRSGPILAPQNKQMGQSARDATALCIDCGLCCLGTLFSHVQTYPDEAEHMTNLGLTLRERGKDTVFDLACTCFKDGCCSVYKKRPRQCVTYICKLSKNVMNGTSSLTESLNIVQDVKEYTKIILDALSTKDKLDLHTKNYRLLLIEHHKNSLQKLAQGTLTAREEEVICIIFEQMKLIDRFFDDTLLLNRYGELIQSFPECP